MRNPELRKPQFFQGVCKQTCLNFAPEGSIIFIIILVSTKPTFAPEGDTISISRGFLLHKHPWNENQEQRTVSVSASKMCRNPKDPLRTSSQWKEREENGYWKMISSFWHTVRTHLVINKSFYHGIISRKEFGLLILVPEARLTNSASNRKCLKQANQILRKFSHILLLCYCYHCH